MRKKCNRCRTRKALSEFAPHPTSRYGVRPECRECRKRYERERVKGVRSNPDADTWDRRMRKRYPGIFSSVSAHKTLCRSPGVRNYQHYGGRGIEYRFDGLLEDACKQILEHLGPRPLGHSLDRIDVDGHFELSNLRWATPTTQSNNRRVRPTAAEWAAVVERFPGAAELLTQLRADD